MKTLLKFWHWATQYTGAPEEQIPRYAVFFAGLFVVGAYVLMSTLDKAGF